MKALKYLVVVAGFLTLLCSCEESYLPKRKGYHKIDLPEPKYQSFERKYPYSFEYNGIAFVKPDSSKFAEPFWINIYYPMFDADVQITYKPLANSQNELSKLVVDSRNLVNKHQVKASGIEEGIIEIPGGDYAYLFELQGEVPSQFQFYTTDSTNNFLRGALYFKTASKNDSLAPVIKYIANDMKHLLKTLQWEKRN